MSRPPPRRAAVARFSMWAPGLPGPGERKAWARGEHAIAQTPEAPSLEFTDPLFRRRLSQISRMTIQVIHDALPLAEDTKIVFVSFRGEIAQQMKINKTLIEQHSVMPAAFSLSVFNAPVALATIALGLTAGYTAIFPAGDNFRDAFLCAAAPLFCGGAREILLVYADELVPPEYGNLRPRENHPLAFAALLREAPGGETAGGIPLESSPDLPENSAPSAAAPESPQSFIKYLLLRPEE